MTAAPLVLAATPLTGHVQPVLNLARHLVATGRRVTVVSGSRFRPQAEAVGAAFVPLSGPADFDDRRLGALQPWLHELAPGPAFLEAMFGWFTAMAPAQNAVLQQVLAQQPDAAVLHEAAFYGDAAAVAGSARDPAAAHCRGLGVFPLTLSGAELTMMGPLLRATGSTCGERLRRSTPNSPRSWPAPPRAPRRSWRGWAQRLRCRSSATHRSCCPTCSPS